jgi:hypothetical protein
MESNGKHVTLDGTHVDYQTGPIYWGEPGTNGQHSFYQLIHQGTASSPATSSASTIPQPARPPSRHADGQRLRPGRSPRLRQDRRQVRAEGVPEALVPHKVFEGNRPSNTILAEQAHPRSPRQAHRPLRALRLHPGRHLVHRLLRPVGRRARQSPRHQDPQPNSKPPPTPPPTAHDTSTTILERMSNTYGESFSVATLDGESIVYIARTTVTRVMSVDLHIGSRLPAFCTSMGRVLLAYLPAGPARSLPLPRASSPSTPPHHQLRGQAAPRPAQRPPQRLRPRAIRSTRSACARSPSRSTPATAASSPPSTSAATLPACPCSTCRPFLPPLRAAAAELSVFLR